jgi:hypothetical protein
MAGEMALKERLVGRDILDADRSKGRDTDAVFFP